LDEFSMLREKCAALKEILLPDDIWGKVKNLIIERLEQLEKDCAFHFPCRFLAFKRGGLRIITYPIHRLIEEWKLPSKIRNRASYMGSLKEHWFLYDDPKKRHTVNRESFEGKFAELLCAEWIEQKGWHIANLEACGGECDIEATSSENIDYAI